MILLDNTLRPECSEQDNANLARLIVFRQSAAYDYQKIAQLYPELNQNGVVPCVIFYLL